MRIEILCENEMEENCYIAEDTVTGKIAVIDPGFEFSVSREKLERVEAILFTHGHFDHIGFGKKLKDMTGAKVYIHHNDSGFLFRNELNLSGMLGQECSPFSADVLLNDGDTVNVGECVFKVMHTPGHTSGSCCFICEDNIFTGDTLFCESIGRTDFPTGNADDMRASLEKLSLLEGEYNIYAGHGIKSTLSREKRNNFYLRGF